MKLVKKFFYIVIAFIILFFAGYKIYSNKVSIDRELKEIMEFVNEVPVNVYTVKWYGLNDSIVENGVFESVEQVNIVSEISGRVLEANYIKGDYVARGTTLASVDNYVMEQELNVARINLLNRKKDLERYRSLLEHDAVTLQQVEMSKLAYSQALAAVSTLEKEIAKYKIQSPVSGYILSKEIDKGSNVMPGQMLYSISALDRINFTFLVSQSTLDRYKKGDSVEISRVTGVESALFGKVKGVAVSSEISGRYRVVVEMDNRGNNIKPGMTGVAKLKIDSRDSRLIIPRSAVYGSLQNPIVFIIENGYAKATTISVESANQKELYVNNGLKEGDTIAISGIINLSDGYKVKVLNN